MAIGSSLTGGYTFLNILPTDIILTVTGWRFASGSEPEFTSRRVDPYSLARLITDWFLIGYCHLRQGLRVFRLSRIEVLSLTTESFQRPPHFTPHWASDQDPDRLITVRARFTAEAIRWVKEAPSFYLTAIEEQPDGPIAILKVRHEDDIFQWLLGWGAQVEVLEPQTLRKRLATEAQKIARLYQNT